MLKLLALVVIVTVFSTTVAFGQVSMGGPPNEDIKISIDGNGTAHVVHVVAGNATSAIHVETVSGTIANFTVSDQAGNSVQYSTINQNPLTILLLPTQRNATLVKYDIPNAVSSNNGTWQWNYREPSDSAYTDFYFPKGVDMIWSHDRPVYLGGKGLRQVGNGMDLAYIINEPETIQTVQWQNQTFNVGIRTLVNAGSPVFDQSSKAYAFDIDKANSYVTVIMPKALLWGPYQSTINTKSILTNPFNDNGTYVWIGMKPNETGTLQVTGTTAIPEFPMFVPLVVAISAVVALRFSNKLSFN
ncbi:MAG TPA: hypothetical protein VJR22_02535 [Candidatus Nitrosotalea sp.]|nr:hypothetical protein [Nitrososphaerota archaeon]HKU32709.1 hypothetical protein [Candidatus Nitrosotalea sp.]